MLLFFALPAVLTAWGLAELFDWMDGTPQGDSDDTTPDDTDTVVADTDTDTDTDTDPDLTNAIVGTDADDILYTEDKETDLYGGEGKDVFWVNDWLLADIVSSYDVQADYAVFDESNEFTVIKDYDYKSGDRILIGYNWLPDTEGTPAPDMSAALVEIGFSVGTSYGQLADGTMGTLIEGNPIAVEGGVFVAAPTFVEGLHDHSFYVDAVSWIFNDTTDPIDEDALKASVLNDESQLYAASDFSTVTNKIIGTDDDDLVHSDDETANLYGGDGADVFWVSETKSNDFDIETDAAYEDPDTDPYGTYLQISDDANITVVRDFDYVSGDRLLIDVNWYPDTEGTAAPTDGLSGIYTNVVVAELPDGTTGALFYSDSSVLKSTETGVTLDGTFDMTPVFVAGYGNPYEFETFGVVYLIRDTDAELDDTAIEAAIRAAGLNTAAIYASDYALSV